MIFRSLHIKKYHWLVQIYYAVTCYHTGDILNSLRGIGCPVDILERVRDNLLKCDMDSGFTYSNKGTGETVMVIGLASSRREFINSLEHEVRHLADDISDVYGLPCKGEKVAYLTGDINGMLADDIAMFLCHCGDCRNKLKGLL